MKIYNWIDSFFDTKQKRRDFAVLIITIYWLWQNIWQCVLYFQLYKVKDYDSLFLFLENMHLYGQSLIINILYEIIMRNTMSIFNIIYSIVCEIKMMDYCMIFMTILLWISSSKTRKFPIFTYLCILLYDLVLILLGFQQESLSGVVHILNVLSVGSLCMELLLIGYMLIQIKERISQILELKCTQIVNK